MMETAGYEVEVEAVVVMHLTGVDGAGSAFVTSLPCANEADADRMAHLTYFLLFDLTALLQQGTDRFRRVKLIDEAAKLPA